MNIPFATLAQRHLVYAYVAVVAIHAIYAVRLVLASRTADRAADRAK